MQKDPQPLKWQHDAANAVLGFDFSNCHVVHQWTLLDDENELAQLDVAFGYWDETRGIKGSVTFRFSGVQKIEFRLLTGRLWLNDFFVSYDEVTEQFCAFDEMGEWKWYSRTIEFIVFEPEKKMSRP